MVGSFLRLKLYEHRGSVVSFIDQRIVTRV